MYRRCIFCSAPLGSNDSIERFPIGRSLAFDGEKGRLWAVCPRCARWNLAPIEERWEAIEEAERLFRDTRLRAQRENIGLAKLRDGTRLIRIGQALPGELAVWRYGSELGRRRRRFMLTTAGLMIATAGVTGSALIAFGTLAPLFHAGLGWRRHLAGQQMHRFKPGKLLPGQDVRLTTRDFRQARLASTPQGLELVVSMHVMQHDGVGIDWVPNERRFVGPVAESVLRRAMVHVNKSGARRAQIAWAMDLLGADGTASGYLQRVAGRRGPLMNPELPAPLRRARSLALEMALHEETERRALDGELAMLQAMWREAEGIAAIADRLPDVDAEPPPAFGGELTMYRSCIFCSAALGSNDSIERFPIGRSLAFDAEKGRLWAVCGKCARWNLAPIEERWEAIEDAERLFRDTRNRVQSENIGLAKLRDGTRLVRVGQALAGELAAWRYGPQLVKRKRRALWYGPAVAAGGLVVYVGAGVAFPVIGIVGSTVLYEVYKHLVQAAPRKRVVAQVETEVAGVRTMVRLRAAHMEDAWLSDPDDGRESR